MNNIKEKQDSKTQIERLAAQRQLYSHAKTKLNFQFILLTTPAVISVMLIFSIPNPVNLPPFGHAVFTKTRAIIAVTSLILALVDILYIERKKKFQINQAAQIQETFDRELFNLEPQFMVPVLDDRESITKYFSEYKKKNGDLSKLCNWYSLPEKVQDLPMAFSRLICQRTNLNWGHELHKSYSEFLLSAIVIITLLIFYAGIVNDYKEEQLILSVIVPLFPAFSFLWRQRVEHCDYADRLNKQRDSLLKTWQQAIQGKLADFILDAEAIKFQSMHHQNRVRAPLVPDWYYWKKRGTQEDEANMSAESLVNEALEAFSKGQ